MCKNRGFTGDQGVIIPQINVKNLMLKKEVVDAVKEGKFRVRMGRRWSNIGKIAGGDPYEFLARDKQNQADF